MVAYLLAVVIIITVWIQDGGNILEFRTFLLRSVRVRQGEGLVALSSQWFGRSADRCMLWLVHTQIESCLAWADDPLPLHPFVDFLRRKNKAHQGSNTWENHCSESVTGLQFSFESSASLSSWSAFSRRQ